MAYDMGFIDPATNMAAVNAPVPGQAPKTFEPLQAPEPGDTAPHSSLKPWKDAFGGRWL